MRVFARSAVIAALFCLCAGLTLRGQTSGQIRGTVVDDEGHALGGVKVEALASSATRTATTGKNGEFRFALLPPGTYRVTFTRDTYSQVEKNANVRLDGTVTVNAKLFRLAG